MNVTILDASNFNTSQWSGGSTTQLYISPFDSSYTERNFDFRISSAKVEVSESTFTPLPGISRKLMVLEGEITVTHENQHTKTLKKFDVDAFKGDWKTSAIGTCTDFNVMTTSEIESELTRIEIAANHNQNLNINENWRTVCIYVLTGSIYLEIENKIHTIKKDSLMVLSNVNKFSFPLHANKRSEIIVSKISK